MTANPTDEQIGAVAKALKRVPFIVFDKPCYLEADEVERFAQAAIAAYDSALARKLEMAKEALIRIADLQLDDETETLQEIGQKALAAIEGEKK